MARCAKSHEEKATKTTAPLGSSIGGSVGLPTDGVHKTEG